jgi:hypothetical protein
MYWGESPCARYNHIVAGPRKLLYQLTVRAETADIRNCWHIPLLPEVILHITGACSTILQYIKEKSLTMLIRREDLHFNYFYSSPISLTELKSRFETNWKELFDYFHCVWFCISFFVLLYQLFPLSFFFPFIFLISLVLFVSSLYHLSLESLSEMVKSRGSILLSIWKTQFAFHTTVGLHVYE